VAKPNQIPSGTVTLLFTDIEGSTRLWETEPDRMAIALRRHDQIVRAAIEQAGGYVFKTVGDAFCAAFATPGSAVRAVLAAQRALGAEAWPTTRPITVRMGVHTGVCEERDADYFGPVVNRAARLEAVAHGGQVLISGTTAELLAGRIGDGLGLRDLGQHRLKDLGAPEQVFQLEAEFLQTTFPPLASLDNPELPNNLPSVLSSFIGRERELAEIADLVQTSRLVTLTGAGGSGKTRLGLQAAAELLDATADGVWFAELAALTEAEQVPWAVAAVLGLPDRGEQPTAESVAHALGGQDALILLDNCEHLIDAAAKFCEHVIRHCPKVRFLTTSREPLGIDGERVYRVPSLSLPNASTEPDELAASDAVRLFVARARVQDGRFTLDAASAPLVATICRRLDGIPLALELAAARLSSMSLADVAARLDQRFRLLTGGSRNAMPRQQTLQATVDWSFSLLNSAERDTLIRLSVFAGGFSLDAAEQVASTENVDALDIMDLLGSLVDKSLVVADRTADSMRYQLLETIRQYCAQELLRADGDARALQIRDRHAAFYLRLAESAAPELIGRRQGEWFWRLDLEWDNFRAAFVHLEAADRTADVLSLGVALERFAISRAHGGVLASLQRAVALADSEPSSQLASASLAVVRMLQLFDRAQDRQLDYSTELAGRGLALARVLGSQHLETRALSLLAGLSYFAADLDAGQLLAGQAAALARQLGDVHLLGEALGMLAISVAGQDVRAIRLEALDCFRQCGDGLLAATELHMIYGLDLHAELFDDAQAHLEEAVALAEPLGDELFLFFFHSDLAMLRLIQGRHSDAQPLVRRCLLAARRTGLVFGAAEVIFGAACCAMWQRELEKAARLHGAADSAITAAVENRTLMWSAAEQRLREHEQGQLRAALGSASYEAAYLAGTRLSTPEAVDLALSRGSPV
jgi:predicted ATPase/class 3 adenylate cyclase